MAYPRFEILNDGPDRWVAVDNASDDPHPVFSTESAAQRWCEAQLRSLEQKD
jgi:hypothetical protein